MLGASAVLWAQLALALVGAVAFARVRAERRGVWLALAALGVCAYTGFGRLHGGRFLHVWDTYHYYLGAKYYDELAHDGLYECTVIADAEAGLRRQAATRTITDLRDNRQVRTLELLVEPERCTRRFGAARWQQFSADVAWFRARIDPWTWAKMQRDHGYNATPVWQLAGAALASLGPASELTVGICAALDPLLLLAGLALLGWGFGWRVMALAALVLGTFYPARFFWTGGAFLRLDWWCLTLAAVSCLRRGRPMLAGAALAYAAMLRLFPAALFLGPALAGCHQLWRTGRLTPEAVRFCGGAVLAVALLAPPALLATGDGGRAFVANTRKHASTSLTNHMGLPTLASYRPGHTARALDAAERLRPAALWPRFAQERQRAREAARPLLWLGQALALLAIGLAARRELWRAAALSSLAVPAFLALTCYYYVLIVVWATLAQRRAAAVCLLAGCAVSTALGLWLEPRVGLDELYVAQSAVLVALAVVVAVATLRGAARAAEGARGASLATPRTA